MSMDSSDPEGELRLRNQARLFVFASASLVVAAGQGYLLGSPLRGSFNPVLLKGAHIDSLLTCALLFGLGTSYRVLKLSTTSLTVAAWLPVVATMNSWVIGTVTAFVGRPSQPTGEFVNDAILFYGVFGVALPQTVMAVLWLLGTWRHFKSLRQPRPQ